MNPIEEVVMPLKEDAMKRAEQNAREVVNKVREELKKVDGDMKKCAPYPSGFISRNEYSLAYAKYNLYTKLTKTREGQPYRKMNDPHFVDVCPNAVKKFVDQAIKDAAAQYVAFVEKLVFKIGEVSAANLTGNHVWSFSILTVTKQDGTTENWKTQMIINVSKLGLLFNQWPTRKIKSGK